MNAQIEALRTALATTDADGTDRSLQSLLTDRARKLQIALDKVTTCVDTREDKYTRMRALRDELAVATEAMVEGDETYDGRPFNIVSAELKRVNDSLDKDIDKVYDQISQAEALRTEVTEIAQKIGEVPLVATAA